MSGWTTAHLRKLGVSTRNHKAIGRVKERGTMNKTEASYAAHLEIRKRVGEILWYAFEPIKFRLADNTFYTPDFGVMLDNREMEFHDTKGRKRVHRKDGTFYDKPFSQEDSRLKIKVAAEQYPMYTFKFPYPNTDGGWNYEEF